MPAGGRRRRRYRIGHRYGDGEIAAAVRPRTLLEQGKVLQACEAHEVAIIFQAADTLSRVDPIRRGAQVIGFPGATLDGRERRLRPLNRAEDQRRKPAEVPKGRTFRPVRRIGELPKAPPAPTSERCRSRPRPCRGSSPLQPR